MATVLDKLVVEVGPEFVNRDQLGRFSKQIDQLEARVDRLRRSLNRAGDALIKGGLALTGAAAAPLLTFAKDEAAWSRVAAQTGKHVGDIRDSYEKGATEISEETGVAMSILQGGIQKAISAGLEGEELLKILRLAAMAQVAGLGAVEEQISSATTAMQAYGVAGEEAINKIARAAQIGEGDPEAYAQNMKWLFQSSDTFGISMDSLAGALSVVAQQAPSVETARTQLQSFLRDVRMMAREGTMSSKALARLSNGAINFESLTNILESEAGIAGVLETLQKLLTGMSRAERIAAESELFASQEGQMFVGTMDPAALKAAQEQVAAGGTAIAEAYVQAANDISRQWGIIQKQIYTILKDLGRRMKPIVELRFRNIEALIKEYWKLPEAVRDFASWIMMLGPTVVALGFALKGAAFALAGFVPLMVASGKAGRASALLFGRFVRILRFLLVSLNPVALAVRALIAAAFWATQNIDVVQRRLREGWSQIREWFPDTTAFLERSWESMSEFMLLVWSAMTAAMRGDFSEARDIMIDISDRLWRTIIYGMGRLGKYFGDLIEGMRRSWQMLKAWLRGQWFDIAPEFKAAVAGMKAAWAQLIEALKVAWTKAWGGNWSEAFSGLRTALANIWGDTLEPAVSPLGAKIWGKIKSGWQAAVDVAKDIYGWLAGKIESVDWQGLRANLEKSGARMWRYITIGWGHAVNVAADVWGWLRKQFESVDWASLGAALQRAGRLMWEYVVIGWRKAVDVATDIWGWLKEKFDSETATAMLGTMQHVASIMWKYLRAGLVATIDFLDVLNNRLEAVDWQRFGNLFAEKVSALFSTEGESTGTNLATRIISGLVAAIGHVLTGVAILASMLFEWIGKAIDHIDWFTLGERFGKWVGDLFKSGEGEQSAASRLAHSLFNVIVQVLKGIFQFMDGFLVGLFKSLSAQLSNWIGKLLPDWFKTLLEKDFMAILNLSDLDPFGWIVDSFKSAVDKLWNILPKWFRDLADGKVNVPGVETVTGAVGGAYDWTKDFLGFGDDPLPMAPAHAALAGGAGAGAFGPRQNNMAMNFGQGSIQIYTQGGDAREIAGAVDDVLRKRMRAGVEQLDSREQE